MKNIDGKEYREKVFSFIFFFEYEAHKSSM